MSHAKLIAMMLITGCLPGTLSVSAQELGCVIGWGKQVIPPPELMEMFINIACGGDHSLAIAPDGSIVAWGYNEFGQCVAPEPNDHFLKVAAGYRHSLALREDGSIEAWGLNDHGQSTVPEPNSAFMAIAGGDEHSLGLKADGSIVAWGMASADRVIGNQLLVAPSSTARACSWQSWSNWSICGWRPRHCGRFSLPDFPNACAILRDAPHVSHLTHRFSVWSDAPLSKNRSRPLHDDGPL